MKKKYSVIQFFILNLAGSFLMFYGLNLLMSDLSNMLNTKLSKDIISSLPIFLAALIFRAMSVTAVFVNRMPERAERSRDIGRAAMRFLALGGILASILTGTLVYGSFTAPYPFKGATVICLAFHILVYIAGLITSIRADRKRIREERMTERRGRHFWDILLLGFITLYCFERFGAFLFAPLYLQQRTLYLTFPFFISLLCPIALYTLAEFRAAGIGTGKGARRGILIVFIIGVLATAAVCITGKKYTEFVSAISPALGIERLITVPLGVLFQGAFIIVFAVLLLIRERKAKE